MSSELLLQTFKLRQLLHCCLIFSLSMSVALCHSSCWGGQWLLHLSSELLLQTLKLSTDLLLQALKLQQPLRCCLIFSRRMPTALLHSVCGHWHGGCKRQWSCPCLRAACRRGR